MFLHPVSFPWGWKASEELKAKGTGRDSREKLVLSLGMLRVSVHVNPVVLIIHIITPSHSHPFNHSYAVHSPYPNAPPSSRAPGRTPSFTQLRFLCVPQCAHEPLVKLFHMPPKMPPPAFWSVQAAFRSVALASCEVRLCPVRPAYCPAEDCRKMKGQRSSLANIRKVECSEAWKVARSQQRPVKREACS